MSGKNRGPELTSHEVGSPDLVPPKFKRLVTTTETRQKVPLTTALGTLAGNVVRRVLNQEVTTERELVITEQTIATGDPLDGEQTGVWGKETTEESVVADGTAADNDAGVRDSRVVPQGNGLSVKETVLYPTPVSGVIGQHDDQTTDVATSVVSDAQRILVTLAAVSTVAAAKRAEGFLVDIQQQNDRQSLLICTRPSGILDYYKSYTVRGAIPPVPPVLKSVEVVWNTGIGAGTGSTNATGSRTSKGSYSIRGGNNASKTGSLKPEIIPVLEQIWTNNLPLTAHFFFLANPSETNIRTFLETKLAVPVLAWPVFKPKTVQFTTLGQTGQTNASAEVAGSSSKYASSTSDSDSATVSIQTSIGSVQIPPCLHGNLSVSGTTSDDINLGVTTAASLSGEHSAFANAAAYMTVIGSVTPTLLTATVPADVPRTGIHLISAQVEPFRDNAQRVFALTLDASILA